MIKLENIHKWFGNLEVLRGIDLTVSRGEVVVVIGPSGSGKSTLLRVINYLEPFQEGTIYLNDQPVFQHHRGGRIVRDSEKTIREIRARIGMVSQRFNLFPHMTVLQNVMTGPVNVRHLTKGEAEERLRSGATRSGPSFDAYGRDCGRTHGHDHGRHVVRGDRCLGPDNLDRAGLDFGSGSTRDLWSGHRGDVRIDRATRRNWLG